MAKKYANAKGRKEAGNFFMFPKAVWECENYKCLSHIARSLLLDIALQYNGKNNGDLTACFSDLVKRGWKSKTTLKKHRDELLHYGFIVCVQHGGINCGGKRRPNLYAVTWLQVDKVGYSDGFKTESDFRVGQVLGNWKEDKPNFYPPKPARKAPLEKTEGQLVYLARTSLCTRGREHD